MGDTRFDRLTDSHVERLKWFADREGTETGYPPPLADGSLLASRPKGIYKPADLEYALSIRINLDSPYADGAVFTRDDGSWYFSYHQENADPSARDREFTNRGLMKCVADEVPVGVLQEKNVGKGQPSRYDVLGLAVPVAWDDGYFFFESMDAAGDPSRRDTVTSVLLSTAEADLEEDQTGQPPPSDDYDARQRALRSVVERRGQPRFRKQLLLAYGGRCAITGCDLEEVLEAAHLRPYRGPQSNTVTNGLPLRADLHTLLDLGLIAIEPDTRMVRVSKHLIHGAYGEFDGTVIAAPRDDRQAAHPDALRCTWDFFVRVEATR